MIFLRNKTLLEEPHKCSTLLRFGANPLGTSGKPFRKIVKTAFYVSGEMFCRKNLIQQFQFLRELFTDFWQDTRITLHFFKNCPQRVERELDRNSLGFFQFLSRVSKLDSTSAEKPFGENYISLENFFNYCFRTSTNRIYVCRGTFS